MRRLLLAAAPLLAIGPLWLTGEALTPVGVDTSIPHRPSSFVRREAEPETRRLVGIATWFDAERYGQSTWYTREGIEFYAAAGPALRELVPHRYRGRYRAIVTAEATGRAVVVWVVDWCSCHGGGSERIVDLSPAVWAALDIPLSRGIMRVSIEPLD